MVVSSVNNCCLELRNCCVKHERVKLNQGMMFATKTVISSEKLWSWPWTLGLKLIIEKKWPSRGIWIVHDDVLRWLWCLLMLIGFPTARLFRSHFSDVQCFGRVKCSGNKRIPINKEGWYKWRLWKLCFFKLGGWPSMQGMQCKGCTNASNVVATWVCQIGP